MVVDIKASKALVRLFGCSRKFLRNEQGINTALVASASIHTTGVVNLFFVLLILIEQRQERDALHFI